MTLDITNVTLGAIAQAGGLSTETYDGGRYPDEHEPVPVNCDDCGVPISDYDRENGSCSHCGIIWEKV